MKKLRKMLGLAAALALVFAMGTVVYAAATYNGTVPLKSLAVGDILEKDAVIQGKYDSMLSEAEKKSQNAQLVSITVDGTDLLGVSDVKNNWTVTDRMRVTSVSSEWTDCGFNAYTLVLETIPEPPASTPAVPSGEPQMSAAERWKNSHQNPDNYLPRLSLADGTELRAAFPAHYSAGKGKNVSAVVTLMEDFCRILGIADGNTVHMKSWYSLCGEKMKRLMADYAALIGEQCSAEVTVGEIFELETEIRDRDYNLLGLAEESGQPVQITIALAGELRELSDTMDFAVVMWADGEVTVLKDVDEEPYTITIETTRTSGVFGIIYAPAGSFDALGE